jgi:8-oxo-dGTP diphosphatase
MRRTAGIAPVVRAAGGVLLRGSSGDQIELAIVHRPDRQDWTFPKGKLEPAESFEECALREVWEETGFHCRLGPFVGTTHYFDRRNRPKIVHYWFMDPIEGAFRRSDEVDELRWVLLQGALRTLTYACDRDLVAGMGAPVQLARSG